MLTTLRRLRRHLTTLRQDEGATTAEYAIVIGVPPARVSLPAAPLDA